jgi:hypothetical protein
MAVRLVVEVERQQPEAVSLAYNPSFGGVFVLITGLPCVSFGRLLIVSKVCGI